MRPGSAPLALASALAFAPALSGCGVAATGPDAAVLGAPENAHYRGVQTRLLAEDLVNLRVTMSGARGDGDVIAYARCAAAQYALIRGYGFARHIRTNIVRTGSNWRGDAVYTVSPTLPRGLATIDAEVTVRDCGARGIPTV